MWILAAFLIIDAALLIFGVLVALMLRSSAYSERVNQPLVSPSSLFEKIPQRYNHSRAAWRRELVRHLFVSCAALTMVLIFVGVLFETSSPGRGSQPRSTPVSSPFNADCAAGESSC